MWVCARLRPDKYGDRIATEISGSGGKDLVPERAADPDRIAQALLLMLSAPDARPSRVGALIEHSSTSDGADSDGDEPV
jgi:hypothetical protein